MKAKVAQSVYLDSFSLCGHGLQLRLGQSDELTPMNMTLPGSGKNAGFG